MKNIRFLLIVVLGFTVSFAVAQMPGNDQSWEKLSGLITFNDQIGLSVNNKQSNNDENIEWMRLVRVYHDGCKLKMDYSIITRPDDLFTCSVSVLKLNSDDLKLMDISGIPSLKLQLSGDYFSLFDNDGNLTGKTNTLFLRACYRKSTYDDLKSAISEVVRICRE